MMARAPGLVWVLAMLLGSPVAIGAAGGDDAVVARAGAITITVGRLRAYAQTHPGVDAKTLLNDLMNFELLAAEALRQGLATNPNVREAENQVLVRSYLKRGFEADWAPDTLPEERVRAAYEKNKQFFNHPELRSGAHILVTEQAGGARPKRPSDPALDAQAQALAERIHQTLASADVTDMKGFLEAHAAWVDEAKGLGLVLKAETLPRFALNGTMDPAFSEAAFKVQAKTVSAAFASSFGWHVTWIETVEPPEKRSFEQVEASIRGRILPEMRINALHELTNALAGKHNALLNPDPIDQLENRRGVDPRQALEQEAAPPK
jgi:hypothetical protein